MCAGPALPPVRTYRKRARGAQTLGRPVGCPLAPVLPPTTPTAGALAAAPAAGTAAVEPVLPWRQTLGPSRTRGPTKSPTRARRGRAQGQACRTATVVAAGHPRANRATACRHTRSFMHGYRSSDASDNDNSSALPTDNTLAADTSAMALPHTHHKAAVWSHTVRHTSSVRDLPARVLCRLLQCVAALVIAFLERWAPRDPGGLYWSVRARLASPRTMTALPLGSCPPPPPPCRPCPVQHHQSPTGSL